MPGKKKKYNARFPPARIKKIMQTDEEVGKVAAAVPVIISRGLELFVESLLTRAGEITSARHARTLTPAHLKQCIMAERRFDFLQDLVASVADINADGEMDSGSPTPIITVTPIPPFTSPENTPASLAPHILSNLYSPTPSGENVIETKPSRGRGRGRGRSRSLGSPTSTPPAGRGAPRPRGRPRKIIPPVVPVEEPDSDDALSLDVDVDVDDESEDTDTDEEVISAAEHSGNSSRDYGKSPSPASAPLKSSPSQPSKQGKSEGSPHVPGLQISVGRGFSLGGTPGKDNEVSPRPVCTSPAVLPPSAASSSPIPAGIQITIPGLPAALPLSGMPPTTQISISPVCTPLATETRPSFGVPVPVITSVYSLKNQLAFSNLPESPPAHSQTSSNQVDEDYDS
ncbi:uncharacterized protein NC2alpha isoform X2 [Procambarus clarkii]|uniref:uncharacterized protein NC2alpha isoform X2 n=1 Tax=Procambarus clarkii TaxID=6728 RepID=UPI001E675FC5|nr:mucin-1-like isoform X2 [Procambarus clarkii]